MGCVQVLRADQPILLMANHKTGLLRAAGCVMPNVIRLTFARWRGDRASPARIETGPCRTPLYDQGHRFLFEPAWLNLVIARNGPKHGSLGDPRRPKPRRQGVDRASGGVGPVAQDLELRHPLLVRAGPA